MRHLSFKTHKEKLGFKAISYYLEMCSVLLNLKYPFTKEQNRNLSLCISQRPKKKPSFPHVLFERIVFRVLDGGAPGDKKLVGFGAVFFVLGAFLIS